jgi:hypothetical protein
MEKVVAEEIKTCKRKEKKDKWTKWIIEMGSSIEWATRKTPKKYART